jgi:carbonic anhydrase
VQLQAEPNPIFDEIVKKLPDIQIIDSSTRLDVFPISNLIRCFQRDYFLYWGSITLMNISNSILWLISRRPLGISVEQVIQLEKLSLGYRFRIKLKGNSLVTHLPFSSQDRDVSHTPG